MSNQLIDRGDKYTPAENVNPDFKQGFLESVKNSQPRMALNYLIDIINELNDRITVLENRQDEGVKEVSDEPDEPKPAAKRTTKTAPAKVEDNADEV